MELSEFAFKLLLLFLPGIICSFIVDAFTNHKERTQFQFVVRSYVYGLLAYALYWLIVKYAGCLVGMDSESVVFLKSLAGAQEKVSPREIAYVCILAVVMSAVITFVHTHKLHFRLFRKLRITNKFGELDVWGYLMNSDDVSWVTVRDLNNNLMYDGWVQAFSDNSREAELLLGDVRVYKNDSGELLYEVASQYMSLDRLNILIEIRKRETADE
jgi:hypothetical protein